MWSPTLLHRLQRKHTRPSSVRGCSGSRQTFDGRNHFFLLSAIGSNAFMTAAIELWRKSQWLCICGFGHWYPHRTTRHSQDKTEQTRYLYQTSLGLHRSHIWNNPTRWNRQMRQSSRDFLWIAYGRNQVLCFFSDWLHRHTCSFNSHSGKHSHSKKLWTRCFFHLPPLTRRFCK